jgi:hypothetical protein
MSRMALRTVIAVACLACDVSGFSVASTKGVHLPTARAAARCPPANLSLRYAWKRRGGRPFLLDFSKTARDVGREPAHTPRRDALVTRDAMR